MRSWVPLRIPIRIALLAAGLVLAVVARPWADGDAKEAEAGAPHAGPGHQGKILLPGADGRILDFPAHSLALLSWLTPQEISGSLQNANDIWGYVSPSGREYAIVGLARGTAFVEVTDPLEPVVVEVISGPRSLWRDMKTYGEFAYSVNETGGGVQVIDLRKIDKGKVKLVRSVTERGLDTAHNIAVNEDSGHLFALGSNLAGGGLVALDLSDPADPRVVPESWSDAYVHDALVVTWNQGPHAGREFVFGFNGFDGLQIIDVTDKSNMFTVSQVRYPGLTYCHSGALNRNRRYLFVNDELDERQNPDVTTSTTYIVKVKDPENPRFVRSFSNGSGAIDHNSMVRGKLLFQANYESGLRLVDARKARRLKEIGYIDTHPESDEPSFTGAWGVYAGLPSGVVLVSDIERGLFVIF